MTRTLLIAVLTLLSGCGANLECNDTEHKQIALNLIQQRLEKAVWYQQMKPALTEASLVDIKTTSINKELKHGSCSATYSLNYNGKPRTIPLQYELAYLEDKGKTEVSLNPTDIYATLMVLAGVEPPSTPPVAESASKQESPTSPQQSDIDKCVEIKTNSYRQEAGPDALVSHDMLGEWESQCRSAK